MLFLNIVWATSKPWGFNSTSAVHSTSLSWAGTDWLSKDCSFLIKLLKLWNSRVSTFPKTSLLFKELSVSSSLFKISSIDNSSGLLFNSMSVMSKGEKLTYPYKSHP